MAAYHEAYHKQELQKEERYRAEGRKMRRERDAYRVRKARVVQMATKSRLFPELSGTPSEKYDQVLRVAGHINLEASELNRLPPHSRADLWAGAAGCAALVGARALWRRRAGKKKKGRRLVKKKRRAANLAFGAACCAALVAPRARAVYVRKKRYKLVADIRGHC